jgi:hypothetical protein
MGEGLGFGQGGADRTAAEKPVTGPVTSARKKLTGGSHLLVAGHRRVRTLSGAEGKQAMGRILAWARFGPGAFYFSFLFFSFSLFYFLFYFKTIQTSF